MKNRWTYYSTLITSPHWFCQNFNDIYSTLITSPHWFCQNFNDIYSTLIASPHWFCQMFNDIYSTLITSPHWFCQNFNDIYSTLINNICPYIIVLFGIYLTTNRPLINASLSMYKVYSLALPYISSHVHYLCPFVYGCLVVLLHFLEHELLVYWKRGNSCGLIDTCP